MDARLDPVIFPSQTTTPRHAVFYFDFGDPFSYLAAGRVAVACRENSVTLTLEPVDSSTLRDGTALSHVDRDFWGDVRRVAAVHGLPLRVPKVYPFDARRLLKACLVVRDRSGHEAMTAVAGTVWQEIWQNGADPADPATAVRAGKSVAIPERLLLESLDEPRADDMLARTTRRARERGVRTVPTLQVESELFAGIDALPAAEAVLRGENPATHRTRPGGDQDSGPPSVPDWTFSG